MSRRPLIFLLFTAAYFLSYFYRSANAVISPDLSSEIGLGAAQLGLMTSLFFAAFASAQIPLGIGLDRWGPRWVTPGLMLATVAGSLVFGAARSFGPLALGRALIGLGMAGVLMGSLKIFSRWFSPRRFATVSGLLVGVGSMGALLAATPLAWLNEAVGWRSVFVGGGAVTALVAGAIMIWARNAPPGAASSETETVQEGGLGQVFTDRRFWHLVPMSFFLVGALLSFQGLWGGPFLFDVYGLGEVAAGNILLGLGVGTTIGYLVSGWLSDRFGLPRMISLASALFILAQFGLALRPSLGVVAVLYVLFGLSGGFNIMLLAHVRMLFPLHLTGRAVTAANVFGIGGTFLLQWIVGLIIGGFPQDAAGRYPPEAHVTAIVVVAAGSLLALLVYLPLARGRVR
jgi:MFS family permease